MAEFPPTALIIASTGALTVALTRCLGAAVAFPLPAFTSQLSRGICTLGVAFGGGFPRRANPQRGVLKLLSFGVMLTGDENTFLPSVQNKNDKTTGDG